MDNFGRTLRMALRFKASIAGIVGCALIVAVLWGGNIGTMYPVVEAIFQGQSLGKWVDGEIADSESVVAECKEKIDQITESLAAGSAAVDIDTLGWERSAAVARLEAEQTALQRYRLIQQPIHDYLPDDAFQQLVLIIAVLIVGTVVKDTFLTIGSVMVERLSQRVVFDLRKQFYRRTLRMDLATFTESGTSDLLSRFTYDLDNVAIGIQTLFGRAIREPLKMIACLIGAALISWRLLVLSLVVAPLAAYLISLLAKTLKRANRKAMEEMSSLYNVLVESFGGIKVVKAFTNERHERLRLHRVSKKCYHKAMRIAIFDSLVSPVTEMLGIAMISMAILLGAYLALSHQTHLLGIRICDRPLEQGGLIMFYAMLAGLSDPARKLSEVFNRIQRAAAACDRIYQLLDRQPAVSDSKGAKPVPRHRESLVFDHVAFGYLPGQRVIEDINLRVTFGETIAIVGPNGCGKSTLAQLIPRFYDPTFGSIKLDGVNLREVKLRALRQQIGIVSQETVLFDDTVLNNIRYGSPWASRADAIDAARQAHAHKFIEAKLDNGYETIVGPQGGRLSGGQRQRIALARAILRNPSILILDEATSQIDLESEQLIHRALEQFVQNRTAVIITHRLATLDLADRIVVMNAGRILDVGTRDELMARCDVFRRLYQIQFKESA